MVAKKALLLLSPSHAFLHVRAQLEGRAHTVGDRAATQRGSSPAASAVAMAPALRCSSVAAALALFLQGAVAWSGQSGDENVPGGAPAVTSQKHRPELTAFPYGSGRGDYHHSFVHPYTPSSEGDPIVHWLQSGSSIVTSAAGRDVVRLVSGGQGLQGVLMSTMHTETNDFNGFFDISITTHPSSAEAADGMGFFFADSQMGVGSAMGIDERFRGLGIVIDTFSNSRTVKVPYLYAFVSDGTKAWSPNSDGKDMELTPGCKIPMDTLVRVYVQFVDSNLHVGISLNRDHRKWHTCLRYNNVPMPFKDGGFMHFAAETGHYYATHDVYDAGFVIGDAFVDDTETRKHPHGMQVGEPLVADSDASSGTAPEAAPANLEESHNKLELHLDEKAVALYSELTDVMSSLGGSSSYAESRALRQSFMSLAKMTDIAFAEIERMTQETRDVQKALIRMRATSSELKDYTQRFSASLKTLHDSTRGLRASNNKLRADHEETKSLVLRHSSLMHVVVGDLIEARPHGVFSTLVFVVLQVLLMAGFAVVAKMGSGAARKMGRMV